MNGTLIKQTATSLHFNGIAETRDVLFYWDNEKLKNVEVGTTVSGGNYRFRYQYEIIEDGRMGRCIFHITSGEFSQNEDDKVGELHLYFTDDKNYRQDMYVEIRQTSTARNEYFLTFSNTIVVAPSSISETKIGYTEYGGETLTDIEFPNKDGVYGSWDETYIDIFSIFNGLSLSTDFIRTFKVKVISTLPDKATHKEYFIDVIILLPYLTPIWKDIDTTMITDKENIEYKITYLPPYAGDTPIIYTGRAYRMPDEKRIRFNINKVCENYLSQHIDMDYKGHFSDENYGKVFRINADGKDICDYIFYNDWGYNADRKRMWKITQNISSPITSNVVRGQTFICSLWSPFDMSEGAKHMDLITESPDNSMNSYTPVEGYENVYISPFDYTTITLDTTKLKPDTKYIVCGMQTYNIVDCPKVKWVIHYLDKYGGYTSFPIYGNVNVSSRANYHSMNKTFNNTTSQFEKKRYLNEMTERYEVTFPMLTKYEASRMDEILQSTEIYLENLKEHKSIPVLYDGDLTDFKNNQKVRNYTVPFITSQSRLRK